MMRTLLVQAHPSDLGLRGTPAILASGQLAEIVNLCLLPGSNSANAEGDLGPRSQRSLGTQNVNREASWFRALAGLENVVRLPHVNPHGMWGKSSQDEASEAGAS